MRDKEGAWRLRTSLVAMWETGMTARGIAQETRVSVTTVYRWIRRWHMEGHLGNRPRGGRPRITSREEDEAIKAAVGQRPLRTAVDIARSLRLSCNLRTIQRRLREAEVQHFAATEKGRLTKCNREHRLGFALEYLPFTPDFWRTVIFSEEKTFTLVKRSSDSPLKSSFDCSANSSRKTDNGKVTITLWGWMWAYGPGELAHLTGCLGGEDYVSVLEDVLLPTVRIMALPEPLAVRLVLGQVVQSKAAVTKWLTRHQEVEVIQWLPKDFDINPLSHIWRNICLEWDRKNPDSEKAAFTQAQSVWESVRKRPENCMSLVDLIPKNLEKIVNIGGF